MDRFVHHGCAHGRRTSALLISLEMLLEGSTADETGMRMELAS